MTYAKPMFPPKKRRVLIPKGIPFFQLTPKQQKALLNLRKLRDDLEAEVERMIAFLDFTDGYTFSEVEADDAEPQMAAIRRDGGYNAPSSVDDDEPSLCGVTAAGLSQPQTIFEADVEADYGRGLQSDDEWSLGSTAGIDQGCWAFGEDGDVEDEHDGKEEGHDAEGDTADGEPSLGWTVDGVPAGFDDREQSVPVYRPHHRTSIPGADKVRVDTIGRKRLSGVNPTWTDRLRKRDYDELLI